METTASLELEEKSHVVTSSFRSLEIASRDNMTTSTLSHLSDLDASEDARFHDFVDECKDPGTPLSIDEDTYSVARVQTVQSASNVLALSSRGRGKEKFAASVPLRRYNSSQSLLPARKQGVCAAAAVSPSTAIVRASKDDERTGFARIYFENKNFTSSTVFKLLSTTTVLEVRKSMAAKIKIPPHELPSYAIVVVFPTDNAGSLSARTLRDDELILPLVERLNRARPTSTVEADDVISTPTRSKPKHRTRPPVKFVLKGVYSGYLQKASSSDPNVWRKRWFIIKGDQLLYCKSNVNQQDVTSISLLGAVLAKAKPEVLCASSKDEMVAWIHALHIQIGICSENQRIYEAEIWITEEVGADAKKTKRFLI
ncbi:hypothetical protein PsorP6_007969 [Peronosclerospora sorghi]|uniref:Uncharacterized protein n=1 Tax=Peronosclerospora sorghi TaxID=230839 RepID=A0ACC0W827_9STRA|nr:hypothetical protein PsorP6_007969 [Peronosclerospora sorghi]